MKLRLVKVLTSKSEITNLESESKPERVRISFGVKVGSFEYSRER